MKRRYHNIRSYSPRKYSNPFFSKRRAKVRRISWKVKILIFLIVLAAGFLGWLLFFNRYFEIENVIVEGGQRIEDYKIYNIIGDQTQENRFFFFNQSNIFSFSKRQAKKEILNNYFVDDLKIDKKLPRTIKVIFSERQPAAVWCEEEKYYYVDENLNILLQIDSLDVNVGDYIILKNAEQKTAIEKGGSGKKVAIGEEYLKACLNLASEALANKIEIDRICKINEKEITVSLNIINNGPEIFFNIEEDLGLQLKKLKALIAEKLKGERLRQLEYIDLRFGEKVYYK
ncbi:MAG: FtsQ-type POTRA domain-containing protein [Patescibacteria group bacterium]|jgi:hypothetical protein